MAMLKVIEVLAESNKSWEDAAQTAVAHANNTLRNVRSIYVKNMEANPMYPVGAARSET